MKITVKYFLSVEKIMEKSFDEFVFSSEKSLKELLEKNIEKEKMKEIEKIALIVTKNGENCKDLDVNIENDDEFCLFPAIYGG